MHWTPAKIKELRQRYGESQGTFCQRLGITVDAYRLWEQGRGLPSGTAQMLLWRLEEDVTEGKIRPLADVEAMAS